MNNLGYGTVFPFPDHVEDKFHGKSWIPDRVRNDNIVKLSELARRASI
jgi:hypothetical protein